MKLFIGTPEFYISAPPSGSRPIFADIPLSGWEGKNERLMLQADDLITQTESIGEGVVYSKDRIEIYIDPDMSIIYGQGSESSTGLEDS